MVKTTARALAYRSYLRRNGILTRARHSLKMVADELGCPGTFISLEIDLECLERENNKLADLQGINLKEKE